MLKEIIKQKIKDLEFRKTHIWSEMSRSAAQQMLLDVESHTKEIRRLTAVIVELEKLIYEK